MKSEINNTEKFSFPKLMKCRTSEQVVCFVSEGCGTVVYPTTSDSYMQTYDGWTTSDFVDFNGSVTLSN